MDDNDIIRLYWDRDDRAIRATAEKYGQYCGSIARNILNDRQDAEECVNDTYLRAWNAMPDLWPERLPPFLGRITRNLAFNRYRHGRAEKRGGGETALVLDELADCVSDRNSAEQLLDRQELAQALNAFVRDLPEGLCPPLLVRGFHRGYCRGLRTAPGNGIEGAGADAETAADIFERKGL